MNKAGTLHANGGGNKCGRWNPTAEQVKVLTDLFRSGLRTPTTDQIQRISSHLSSFGRIESKNVFYWFQNHKARERHHHMTRRRTIGRQNHDLIQITPSARSRDDCMASACSNLTQTEPEQEQDVRTLNLFPLNSDDGSAVGMRKTLNMDSRRLFHASDEKEVLLDLRLSSL